MEEVYFEDYEVGKKTTVGEYVVKKEEVIEFAKKWDPQPFHMDEQAANGSVYGGLTASGVHIMSIRTWLLHKSHKTKLALLGGLAAR